MPNTYVPRIGYEHYFPNPKDAVEGIVAWGGDLNPNRVLNAYLNGIFPWFNEGDPPMWWSPDPRLVLYLEDFKVSKSLKKSIKKFDVQFDHDFTALIRLAQKTHTKNHEHTWITEDIIHCFAQLHEMGFAHSVETYYEGKLVGGLYGIAFGGIFCGETMCQTMSDASKVALYHLVERLKSWDFDLIDAQVPSDHLKSLGAQEISRDRFLNELEQAKMKKSLLEKWTA
jgi:leucyl/phenylalanyl-tRNA--protein transferase